MQVQRAAQDDALEPRDIERALGLLPLEQWEILLLVGLEALGYTDVARVLKLPQGTVMSRLSRARQRFKAHLPGATIPRLKVVKT